MGQLRISITRLLVVVGLGGALLLSTSPLAYAHNGEVHTTTEEAAAHEAETSQSSEEATTTSTDQSTTRSERLESRAQASSERQEVRREELAEGKKRVCDARETQINTIMNNVVLRSDRRIDFINKISERVQDFYTKSGVTLSNYDELVSAINEQKSIAQTSIESLKTKATFACDSDGPKADVQDFRNHRLDKVDALSEYRAAVRALIDAIQQQLGEGNE